MRFHLRTLGRIELWSEDGERLPARRKELVLLTYVARAGGNGLRRDVLAALFWSESTEANARNSLRQVVLRLRRVLGEAIDADAERVAVRPDTVEIDVDAFESVAAAVRPIEAAELWEGEFLPGAEDTGGETVRAWIESERARLRRRLDTVLEQLVAEAESRGAWPEAIHWAERRAREFPLEERPIVRWIEVLLASGRVDEARAVHSGFIARWTGELQQAPPPSIIQLGERLLQERTPAEPVRTGPVPLFTPDLIGRSDAFAQLDSALRRVVGGGRAVVRVEGEIGVGTTRLCDEFLRAAGNGPILVLRTQGYEAERHIPLATARDLLAGLRAAPGLAGAPDACLAEVALLVPSIRERFRTLPAPTGAARARDDALIRVLADIAAEQPIVLFVDRFPSADPESQRLLLSLARRLPEGVMLLLTGTEEGFAQHSELAELPENGLVQRIRLKSLTEPEIEAMLASMLALPDDVRRELAGRLHAESEGNPRLVVELVTTLVEEGQLTLDTDGSWCLDPSVSAGRLPLPSTLREAVQRRLEHLGKDAASVLAAASVLPMPAPVAPLKRLTGLGTDALSDALDELVTRRLLREAHPPGTGYVFGHELVRRVTYERLPLPRRQMLEQEARAVLTAPAGKGQRPTTRWRRWLAAAALLLAALSCALWLPGRNEVPATVAVGAVRAEDPADSAAARLLPEMLATGLAQAPGLRVISSARMYETLARIGERGADAQEMLRAARSAGADEILEGGLFRRPDGALRLELRRIDLKTGEILSSYTVQGADAFELADAATARLAGSAPNLARITTTSLTAYRFYQEGLRAYYLGNHTNANHFFEAAIREDSSFAIATYYAALTKGLPESVDLMKRAVRLAERASDRERLLILAEHAAQMDAPERLAIAETLAIRYPHEPDGPLLLGRAHLWAGDFEAAAYHLRRTIELDSLSLTRPGSRCRACDAYEDLGTTYHFADSLEAAERLHLEWARRQPTSAKPWIGLAYGYMGAGHLVDAYAAVDSAEARQPATPLLALRTEILLRDGDVDGSNELLAPSLRSADPATRADALWNYVIGLRTQGRLEQALLAATELRDVEARTSSRVPSVFHAVAQAQVLFELGEHHRAAAMFDSIASIEFVAGSTPRNARHQAWMLTHAASAWAAAGDTARLAALADTVRDVGARSAYARDQRLHHYVHALLLRARGDHDGAIRELRRSQFSPASGYIRANLELGRTLLLVGRAEEAAREMETALRGPVGASGFYATHTELHELAAHAWDRAGRPDRAVPHYRWVARVWSQGDPSFRRRAEAAAARLREIQDSTLPRTGRPPDP